MPFGVSGWAKYTANTRQNNYLQQDYLNSLQSAQKRGLGINTLGGGTGGISGGSGGGVRVTSSTSGGGAVPANTPTNINVTSNLQSASEQTRYDPWSRYRDDAGDILAGKMGQGSPSDIYRSKLEQMVNGEFNPDDPSYQWRYDQGQKAVERSMAAKGLLNSGNAAIELQQYGQGAASQEYGAQFSRLLQGLTGTEQAYDMQMSRLMKMAGVDIDPTAGGMLNVAQEKAGIERAGLGLQAQKIANDYSVGMSAAQNRNLQPIFSTGGSGVSSSYQPVSWDAYFSARDAHRSTGMPQLSALSAF